MNLMPFSRTYSARLWKWPFLHEFLDEPDIPSCPSVAPLGTIPMCTEDICLCASKLSHWCHCQLETVLEKKISICQLTWLQCGLFRELGGSAPLQMTREVRSTPLESSKKVPFHFSPPVDIIFHLTSPLPFWTTPPPKKIVSTTLLGLLYTSSV